MLVHTTTSHLLFLCLFHLWVQEPHMPEVACFLAEAGRFLLTQVGEQLTQPTWLLLLTICSIPRMSIPLNIPFPPSAAIEPGQEPGWQRRQRQREVQWLTIQRE